MAPEMKNTPSVQRINSGIYDVSYKGQQFELERYPDGSWLLFCRAKNEYTAREYMNDFATKRDALAALSKIRINKGDGND